MFIESVLVGLGTLTNWQTYVAALLFLCLSTGPVLIIGLVASTGRSGAAIGCVSMLLIPFLQTFALVVFVLSLSPVMLGLSSDASWVLPWSIAGALPWDSVKMITVLLSASVLLRFLPFIGALQSLHTLMLGGVALFFTLGILQHFYPQIVARDLDMWPGFWFVFGLVVIGSTLSFLGTVITEVVADAIDVRVKGLGHLVSFPITAALGFIPLFIYAAWLGLHIRAAH